MAGFVAGLYHYAILHDGEPDTTNSHVYGDIVKKTGQIKCTFSSMRAEYHCHKRATLEHRDVMIMYMMYVGISVSG